MTKILRKKRYEMGDAGHAMLRIVRRGTVIQAEAFAYDTFGDRIATHERSVEYVPGKFEEKMQVAARKAKSAAIADVKRAAQATAIAKGLDI